MKFKQYNKIHAIHKEECEGLLNGFCYIQEKVDGANASIWLGDDGEIHYGSRSRDLFLEKDNFNGFGDWINDNKEKLSNFFKNNNKLRINGEWLLRHTIGYNELSYKKFYAFDIEEELEIGESEPKIVKWDIDIFYGVMKEFDIPTVHLFAKIENPTLEQIKEYAGKSVLGEKGEGVVIKNLEFVNKYGVRQFGKYVTSEFKEDNAITFGGNNKSSETYCEMYYVNKYMTLARVQKIFHKLESEEGSLDYEDIPQIMGRCYYDLITEESFTISKEMAKSNKLFDFKEFQNLCYRKSKSIFIELLTGDISVANKE